MASKVEVKSEATIRKLGCIVPATAGNCKATAEAKAAAWKAGGIVTLAAGGNGTKVVSVVGASKTIVDGESRLFLVSVADEFTANYGAKAKPDGTLAFAGTPSGELFAELSAIRDPAKFRQRMSRGCTKPAVPTRVFSGSYAPDWKRARVAANASAKAGGFIVLIPVSPECFALYGGDGAGRVGNSSATIGDIAAEMAGCE